MSQQALVVTQIGQPLTRITRPIPEPKQGQLLIKVTVAGLNPHDAKAAYKGLFIKDSLPSPLAIDLVGTVVRLGSGVSNFSVGDRVFTLGNPFDPDSAGTQEYAIATADSTAKVPTGVKDDEAATLALNPLTAFWGVFRKGPGMGIPPPAPFVGHEVGFDYKSLSLAVIGGGSAVGKYVIAWAKFAGVGTILTTASKGKNEKELLGLGATHVLDRHLSPTELTKAARDIVGDDLRYVYDAVNVGQDAEIGATFLSKTKPSVLIVIAGGAFDASKIEGLKEELFERKMIYAGPDPAMSKSYWNELPKLIEQGVVEPTAYSVIEGLDVGKTNEALQDYIHGKNVVKPHLHLS